MLVKESDKVWIFGPYSCRARNRLGDDRMTFHIREASQFYAHISSGRTRVWLYMGEVTSQNLWLNTIAILWVYWYNTTYVELIGEDLLRYSNTIVSSDLRQCPHDH